MNIRQPNVASHQSESLPSDAARLLTCDSFIIGPEDRILITGATGFVGPSVVECLLNLGFRNLICFARPSSHLARIEASCKSRPLGTRVEILKGNLLSREDCEAVSKDVSVIFHLAAGTGEKSFPDAFMNSVVTTRNLLDASLRYARLRRFVLVSSFAVYSNRQKSRLLEESCPIEEHPELRGEAYCFAKVKQEQILTEYGRSFRVPYVVVRPGSVYGPGKDGIIGRVGIGAFGIFVHLGGSNTIPLTYVDNCAEAIVLAGLVKGVESEVFNVVDDDLPTSREYLRLYKESVGHFKSVYLPHAASHALCYLWEKYSQWSNGQLPPVFTRARWYAYWRKTRYSNQKLKARLGWTPKVPTAEGLRQSLQNRGRGSTYA